MNINLILKIENKNEKKFTGREPEWNAAAWWAEGMKITLKIIL